jgi:hypothetical protein
MTTTVPFFVFLWLPSKQHNSVSQNEMVQTLTEYQYATSLIRPASPVQSCLYVVPSLAELLNRLRPIDGYLPVFVLLGHGTTDQGSMHLWNKEVLTMPTLLQRWKCDFRCDMVATQCGANAFVSPMKHTELMDVPPGTVRFIAAAQPASTVSNSLSVFTDGTSMHAELTQLMLHYMRKYDEGGRADQVRHVDAYLKQEWHRLRTTSTPPSTEQPQQPSDVALAYTPTSWYWRAPFVALWLMLVLGGSSLVLMSFLIYGLFCFATQCRDRWPALVAQCHSAVQRAWKQWRRQKAPVPTSL